MNTRMLSTFRWLKISSLFVALGVLGSTTVQSQVKFENTYTPPGARSGDDAQGYCVQPTSDGGYIVAGSADQVGSSNRDMILVKTDANGALQWTYDYSRTLSTAERHEARYVIEVDDNNDGNPDGYLMVGWTSDQNSDKDIFAVKVDLNGNLLWQTMLGDINNTYEDQAFAVRQDPVDRNYVLVGGTQVQFGTAVESRLLVMKINRTNGSILWDNAYGDPNATSVFNMTQGYSLDQWDWNRDGTPDGWVVAGWISFDQASPWEWGDDIFLIGMDFNGNPMGMYRIGVAASLIPDQVTHEHGLSIIQRTTGPVLIAGQYEQGGTKYPFMISLPSDFHRNGIINWMHYYSSQEPDFHAAYCARQEPYGIVVATGNEIGNIEDINQEPTPPNGTTFMFNTNSLGSVVNWGKKYLSTMAPAIQSGNAYSVRVTEEAYVLTGLDATYVPGQNSVYLVKTNWFGVTCDEDDIDIDVHDLDPYKIAHGSLIDITLDDNGISAQKVSDLVDINWCFATKPVPAAQPSTGEDIGISLGSRPNPLSAGSDLSFALSFSTAGTATMIVSDMTGRVIHSEESAYSPGTQDFRLNTAGWPAGTYTLLIEAEREVYSDKIVVLE